MRRAVRVLSIVGCGALVLGGYYWTRKIPPSNELASAQHHAPSKLSTVQPRAVVASDDVTLPPVPNRTQSNDGHAPPDSQAYPTSTRNQNIAAPAHPPLSKAQLDELLDRHDCKNVPRTPARLVSDLEYFELASEKWSDTMLAAYRSDFPSAATSNKNENRTFAVSALIQRCVDFDEVQKAEPKRVPRAPNIDWSDYPEWAHRIDVYDAKQIEKLIAAGQIKLLILRARQNLETFTKLPGSRGDLAYRDFRTLQLLHVPLSNSDHVGISTLKHLLRNEIIAQAELDAQQLARQLNATR